MARKRYITSAISTDRKLYALAEEDPTAALMWPWFVTAFDDWGRMNADPIEVKLTIFPAFPYTSNDIAEAIKLFDKYGLAHYYVVDGKPYLAVNPQKWWKYQSYIKDERKNGKETSKHPPPPDPPWEDKSSAKFADYPRTSAKNLPSPSPSPSLSCNNKNIYMHVSEDELKESKKSELEQRECVKTAPSTEYVRPGSDDSDSGEKGMGEAQEETAQVFAPTVGKAADEYDPDFEAFWAVYPRQVEKKRAYRVWRTRIREGVPPGDLIKAARNYRSICLRTGTDERFVKYPANFLGEDKPYKEFLSREAVNIGKSGRHSESDAAETDAVTAIDFSKFFWKGK